LREGSRGKCESRGGERKARATEKRREHEGPPGYQKQRDDDIRKPAVSDGKMRRLTQDTNGTVQAVALRGAFVSESETSALC
jgi:hypothetical protein